jgi:hypothetical protein
LIEGRLTIVAFALATRRACSIEPLVECEPGAVEDGNRGYCVPDR